MASSTILFFGDLLHNSNSGVLVTASATDTGYSVDNVRDTNLLTSWKAPDHASTSYTLNVDGVTTTWIGAAGETAYVAVAYDARNNEQDTFKLEYGAVDDGAFATPTSAATLTLTKNGSGVQCQYASFTIPATAKRYWRLTLDGAQRTEAAGDNVPKIYAFSMFDKDSVYTLGTSPNAADTAGAGRISPISRVGVARTAVGSIATNKFAEYGMAFETTFQPASITFWEAVRGHHASQAGPHRANFVQYEGLLNTAQDDFFLCRMTSNEFPTMRSYVDQYESGLAWETEPWL